MSQTLPKREATARRGRHHHPRMRFAHERSSRVALSELPLPEKRSVVAALAELMRNRSRIPRQRIVVSRHSIFRRRNSSQKSRPRKGPKRVRRHRLPVVDTLRGQGIQTRRPRIPIPRKAQGLPTPLRRHNPQDIRVPSRHAQGPKTQNRHLATLNSRDGRAALTRQSQISHIQRVRCSLIERCSDEYVLPRSTQFTQ